MKIYTSFAGDVNAKISTSGSVKASSPSNIALVKYWGKRLVQIPENPSISFTLDACRTTTTLSCKKIDETGSDFDFEFYFDGKFKPDFKPKIKAFFERIEAYVPWIRNYKFVIESSNTFPHSSGIASSASGMSALAHCLMQLERTTIPEMDDAAFHQKVSFLSRLGSGSASRSVEGPVTVWGNHREIAGSSDLFAVKYPDAIHTDFDNYHDTILLIDKGEKQVSSSVGHDLMHGHPFAERRFEQANTNVSRLKTIFTEGDINGFIEVVESEALTLHAMMMTSIPYFMLMKPNTLAVINKVWEYRDETGSKLCFTLDAGANVHLLYPEQERASVFEFINTDLVGFCQNGHYICDKIGLGAKIL